MLYFLIDEKADLCLVAFRIYQIEGVFAEVIYILVLGISLWLLEDNDINVENIFDLKKWNHNNIAILHILYYKMLRVLRFMS